MASPYAPGPSLCPPDHSIPPNFNSHPLGGLSRSSRQNSLAHLASAPSPSSPASERSDQWDTTASTGSATPPSSFGLTASPPASSYSTSAGKGGFIVTSRNKVYKPPPSPSAPASTSLPTPSPPFPPSPLPGAALSHNPSLTSRRSISPPAAPVRKPSHASSKSSGRQDHSPPTEPKTTLTLSSSIDSQGRRMVNQYVRLKTIGQGSHGKVWLCAEPTLRESDEDELDARDEEDDAEATARRKGKAAQVRGERWEDEIDSGDVRYCAIKSVAREGTGRGKSLRAAKGRKASSQGSAGIGADDKIKREVAIMKRLDHPNIVRLKEVIDDVKSKKVFMVLEFMAGGQIVWQDDQKRPTMTVDEARRTFRDVVLGLEYLHYQGIIHRDIKPANLLWTEDHSIVKISDFGVSHVSEALLRASPLDTTDAPQGDDDKALRKTAGSPAFFAPELCHPVEYTPTPLSDAGSAYFPPDASASPAGPSHSELYTPLSPNGIPLTATVISPPLPPTDPAHPRPRPTIGKAIDVWALGVTLFCLLFGDTPFMARTEYELYNIIAREGVRIPERMGKEGAWTGVPSMNEWEGKGDGEEGREVVDLLARLLEKDPEKRISLEEVKKHPWVLRNLEGSPDSWLCDTDPAQTDTVMVTEEDVEHATQERGAVDSLPLIRNRPGIRRALNAALVRFPAFARIKSNRRAEATARSRSKSASSTSQSAEHDHQPTNVSLSRFPTDELNTNRKKPSLEFGMDIRRIISGEQGGAGSTSRSSSPAGTIGRGGWGNYSRRKESNPMPPPAASPITVVVDPEYTPAPGSPAPNLVALPELSRSVSSSSVPTNGRGFGHHLLGSRKNSERSDTSPRGTSTPSSESESIPGRRTLARMLSKLGGGERRGGGRKAQRKSSLSGDDDDDDEGTASANGSIAGGVTIPAALVEHFETAGDKYDSLGRVVKPSGGGSGKRSQRSFVVPAPDDEAEDASDDEDLIDLTEFEYSESDDDDDDDDYDEDLVSSPIDVANGISGWHSAFSNFGVGVHEDGHALFADVVGEHTEDDLKQAPSFTATLEDSTPRQSAHKALSTKGIDPDPSIVPPPLVRQHSSAHSPTRSSTKLSIPTSSSNQSQGAQISPSSTSPRDGSIRGVSMDPPCSASRRYEMFGEDGDEDDDAGIFLAPRRRRATTVSGEGGR